jgi:exodeoxyribonuclease VII large subunit
VTLPLFPPDGARPRTVSLVRLAGEIARSAAMIGRVAVEGEVHRPTKTGSGRVYFVLRDRAAQISVTCPSARANRCRTVAGERACVVGSLSWVNERGQLQLVADEVSPVGDGDVAAMVAEARRRLQADGLLDRPRRSIPRLPHTIGVVCGSEAAVRKDIESVVAVRFPGYPMRVAETSVSGPGAAMSIMAALQALAAEPDVEVVILARGGGDATQLLPWSDEDLCRAICACGIPVVSAIGHEGDRPLCDDVADLRCGTPSLAAASVVPDRAALLVELASHQDRARRAAAWHIERAGRRLAAVDTTRAVSAGLGMAAARITRNADRLHLLSPRRQLAEAHRRLAAIDPLGPAQRGVEQAGLRLAAIDWRSPQCHRVQRAAATLAADRRHLDALSPASVLDRGYAVVRIPGGVVLRRAGQVAVGQAIDVQLAAGRLAARVEEVLDGRG